MAPRSGHSGIPPHPPRCPETCWLPARSRRSAGPGRAAPEPHARRWRRGVSAGEEGRPGRRRGRRRGGGRGGGSAAIGTPPPRPLPAALPPRGRSGRLPPSQPLGAGAFPLPAPGWEGGRAEVAARSPWHRSRDAAALGSPTAAGVPRGPESHRLHLSPPVPSPSAEPPAALLVSAGPAG